MRLGKMTVLIVLIGPTTKANFNHQIQVGEYTRNYCETVRRLARAGLSVLSYPNDVGHFQIKVVVNQMFQITLLSVVSYFLGGLLISLSAATIFVLAFETPFTRVEKILVRENSQSSCKVINV